MKSRSVLVGGVCIALVIVLYTFFSEGGWKHLSKLQDEEASLQRQVEQMQDTNSALLRQVQTQKDASDTGKSITETAVRKELGYVKPNEHLLLLPEQDDAQQEVP